MAFDASKSPNPPPQPGHALDTLVAVGRPPFLRRKHLYVDSSVIRYGDRAVPLHRVTWIGYRATRRYTQEIPFSARRFYSVSTWEFLVGDTPFPSRWARPAIRVRLTRSGKTEHEDTWARLVDFSRATIEPLLTAGLVDRIEAGEALPFLRIVIDRNGIAARRSRRHAVAWHEIEGSELVPGFVLIHRRGTNRRRDLAISVPTIVPNGPLVPGIVAALLGRRFPPSAGHPTR